MHGNEPENHDPTSSERGSGMDGSIDFSWAELKAAYRAVGVERGRSVYVTGNLGRLGLPFDDTGKPLPKRTVLAWHRDALRELVGPDAAIVFPTHSWKIVGTDTPFDPLTTRADYTFSEFLRKEPDAQRQAHPFASVAAIGGGAGDVIAPGLARYAYGPHSPFARLAALEALHVSIGLPARKTISAVHQCEQMTGVPYRYMKSFSHPVTLDGQTRMEEIFLYVLYRGTEVERDGNVKIFALPPVAQTLRQSSLGQAGFESVDLGVLVPTLIEAMHRDPYIWLRHRPENDPPWTA